MSSAPAVTTIKGTRLQLVREIGRGGQGAVYEVKGGKFAVKLLSEKSKSAEERLRNQLAMLARLPLGDLALARPIDQLRPPHVGYVMELFTGMVPMKSLMHPDKGETSVRDWYIRTGGLRRRLRLLARTADILAALHGRGLIYVDPSPNNVFVSEDISACEVQLIDTDNVRTTTIAGAAFFTPGYGAPELIRQTGLVCSLTDCHAFAVMAFELLAITHPMLGDLVEGGPPELEEQAFEGKLPWIDHGEDARNRASSGIPRSIVLSELLTRNFAKSFEQGMENPQARPGMARWAELFHRAADRTMRCRKCPGTFYSNRASCPWCEAAAPPYLIAAAMLWDPQVDDRSEGEDRRALVTGNVLNEKGRPRIVDSMVIADGEPIELVEAFTHGTASRDPALRLEFAGGRLNIEPLNGHTFSILSVDGKTRQDLTRGTKAIAIGKTGAAWVLQSGSADKLHRRIRFDLRSEGHP